MAENNHLTKVSLVIRSYGTIMRAHRREVSCTVMRAKVRHATPLAFFPLPVHVQVGTMRLLKF